MVASAASPMIAEPGEGRPRQGRRDEILFAENTSPHSRSTMETLILICVHGAVDFAIVWGTVQVHLPEMIQCLAEAVKAEGE
jgi:hypothetical protein